MRRVISFSVWGSDPIYHRGLPENIEAAAIHYPGWQVVIYYERRCLSDEIVAAENDGATVIPMDGTGWPGLFWRFRPVTDPNNDVVIVRDADSRLNARERAAVDQWLTSGATFHCMRDHFEHAEPIMGGLWGCRGGSIPDFPLLLESWTDRDQKGKDQEFLRQKIWPVVRDRAIVHDRWPEGMVMLPGNEIVSWRDVVHYDDRECAGDIPPLTDQDFEAHKKLADSIREGHPFPHGKIVLRDGREFSRDGIYEYDPIESFGMHDIRPFPTHPAMHGDHVGEIIRCS